MNVFFDGVEALRARYAYLSGGGCTAICGVVAAHFAMLPECTYRRVRKDVIGFSRTDCGT